MTDVKITPPAVTSEPITLDRSITLPPLQMRYYRRMRFQRVYPAIVTWRGQDHAVPQGTGPVTLRLSIAGAQVVPAEQTLETTNPEAKAVFHVTPLAKGQLRQSRLEVWRGNKKIDELALGIRSVTQRPTLILLALVILVPWFILSYFKYSPLERDIRDKRDEKSREVKPARLVLKESVARRLRDNLPELPRFQGDPALKTELEKEGALNAPEFVRDAVEELRQVPDHMGGLYEDVLEICRTYPVAFYAGSGLLLLALWSLFVNNPRRAKVVGKPISIPRPASRDVVVLAKD